jgi:DNA/RNA endonuclease G (NUC1)
MRTTRNISATREIPEYHQFSIVMHRMQRLALFAACNIDGRKPKKVDRDIGAVSAS